MRVVGPGCKCKLVNCKGTESRSRKLHLWGCNGKYRIKPGSYLKILRIWVRWGSVTAFAIAKISFPIHSGEVQQSKQRVAPIPHSFSDTDRVWCLLVICMILQIWRVSQLPTHSWSSSDWDCVVWTIPQWSDRALLILFNLYHVSNILEPQQSSNIS